MSNKDIVSHKEQEIRRQLEQLRSQLNQQRIEYDKNPNYWAYLPSLAHTEKTLAELLDFLKTN